MRELTAYEHRVFEFMGAREYTRCHVERLRAIEATYYETHAEAGPNAAFCPYAQADLQQIAQRREDIIQRAVDRFQDWATD